MSYKNALKEEIRRTIVLIEKLDERLSQCLEDKKSAERHLEGLKKCLSSI